MGPWAALSPALVISLACLAGLAALRFMQSTEWDLTWNGLIQARGMWLGRHVEGGRTIGVVFSHIAGVGAWAMLGWAAALQPWEGPWMSELPFQWDSNPSTPWHGAAIGAAIGLFSLPLRWFGRELCGWMSEVSDVAWQHGETDRLMRNVLSAMLIVEVLFVAVNCCGGESSPIHLVADVRLVHRNAKHSIDSTNPFVRTFNWLGNCVPLHPRTHPHVGAVISALWEVR
jgi:hypothetical protein